MSVNVKQNGSLTKVGGLYHDSTLGQELDKFNVSTADVLDADYILTKSGSTWYRKALSKVRDYIDKVLAPIENGTTASQAYAIGEHFVRNGDFCTVIAAIASNATLTENTNYVTGKVADFLTLTEKTLTVNSDVSSWVSVTTTNNTRSVTRSANVVCVQIYFTVSNMPSGLSADQTIFLAPYKNRGKVRFGQLNKATSPSELVDCSVYIGDNSNYIHIRTSNVLPNANYYLSITYMTRDAI